LGRCSHGLPAHGRHGHARRVRRRRPLERPRRPGPACRGGHSRTRPAWAQQSRSSRTRSTRTRSPGTTASSSRTAPATRTRLSRRPQSYATCLGAAVTVFPHTVDTDTLAGYDGVVLSNGPGDPDPLVEEATVVRDLLGRTPVFGICLGHQLLGLATGHETFKLPFGHRGANHPVLARES